MSEPVSIAWKSGRDLTGGLLDLVVKAYASSASSRDQTAEQKELARQMENTGMGGLSFFAWFGFIGRRISAAENAAAVEEAKKGPRKDEDTEEEFEALELDLSLEIFSEGEELALAFADDLWPSAIKYFSKSLVRVVRALRGLFGLVGS